MENGFALILSELKKLKSAYESQFNSLSNKEDLTQIELTILGFLLNNPTFNTAKDIEEVHVLKKSNISNAIEHLILRGYLTRNRDTQDRRIIHLEITKKRSHNSYRNKRDSKRFFYYFVFGH
ncbi:MAG: MarR family transcriptional regulator [Bacilli bacterium]